MAITDFTKPDDLVEAFLASVFGPHGLVLYVFVVATWLLAWYALAAAAHRRTRDACARSAAVPGVRRARTAFCTALTPLARAVHLALSYFVAARLEPVTRETERPADVDVSTWLVPAADPTGTPAFRIWFTAALLLVASGWWSAGDVTGGITPFRPIAWFHFACGTVAVPVLLLANREMALLALVHVVTAVLSLYLPRTCAASWRTTWP
ncbi:hypothetical protein [Streptomyces sp. NBC_01185]|uniref:hypothetical protein n=1 Tax=Streptomyces sp. NBC_01185 TaxID=2903764 RepID=UPI00386A79B0|nr:hypothetical protein OG770_30740 [Streptomyces sp. NBC_01185]